MSSAARLTAGGRQQAAVYWMLAIAESVEDPNNARNPILMTESCPRVLVTKSSLVNMEVKPWKEVLEHGRWRYAILYRLSED